jgi:hypothetical protein
VISEVFESLNANLGRNPYFGEKIQAEHKAVRSPFRIAGREPIRFARVTNPRSTATFTCLSQETTVDRPRPCEHTSQGAGRSPSTTACQQDLMVDLQAATLSVKIVAGLVAFLWPDRTESRSRQRPTRRKVNIGIHLELTIEE